MTTSKVVTIALLLSSLFAGCSDHAKSLKTTNCSAKIEFNCNCDRDKKVVESIVDDITTNTVLGTVN